MSSSSNSTMDPSPAAPDLSELYAAVDDLLQYGTKSCINYSAQFAASLTLLIVVVLVTRPEKRSSAFFILNAIALATNVIRVILTMLYFTGPAFTAEVLLEGNVNVIPQRVYNISIAADVFDFFLAILVEASLVLQVRAICGSMDGRYKKAVIAVSATVAFVTVTLHFAFLVVSCLVITHANFDGHGWLTALTTYWTAASICWFSAIFTTKLGYAVIQRRRLGLKQFGPMQIIFIVSSQTLIIPALVSIFQNFVREEVPDFGSVILTLVAIFLPLSSMWAAASTNANTATNGLPDSFVRALHPNANGGMEGGRTNSTSDQRLVDMHSRVATSESSRSLSTPGDSTSWIDKELEKLDQDPRHHRVQSPRNGF